MRLRLAVLCIVVLVAAAGFAQEAEPAAEPAVQPTGVENLFAEVGGGYMMPEGEDSTSLVYGALNYGFPIVDIVRVGGQVGGKLTLRDHDPDYLASLGVFQRGVKVNTVNTAWAIQGIYQNTWAKADLISIRPTWGVELGDYDYLAVTGIWGLKDEKTSEGVQQPVDTALLLYGAEWSDKVRTELAGGYAFSNVESILLGVHCGMAIDEVTSLNLTGSVDFEGNYYAAVSVGFDLGGTGRNATFNNISMTSETDYTPFPLGSLPVMFYETEKRR